MLCVKPQDDPNIVQAVLKQFQLSVPEQAGRLLTAEEQAKTLGFVYVEQKTDKLFLHVFEVTDCADYGHPAGEDLEIAEYLVRAAGNYAYNRLLPVLECARIPALPLLRQFGFKQFDQNYRLALEVLFKKCENCGGT